MQSESKDSPPFCRTTGFAEDSKFDGEQIAVRLQRRGNRPDSFVLPELFVRRIFRSRSVGVTRSAEVFHSAESTESFILPESFV